MRPILILFLLITASCSNIRYSKRAISYASDDNTLIKFRKGFFVVIDSQGNNCNFCPDTLAEGFVSRYRGHLYMGSFITFPNNETIYSVEECYVDSLDHVKFVFKSASHYSYPPKIWLEHHRLLARELRPIFSVSDTIVVNVPRNKFTGFELLFFYYPDTCIQRTKYSYTSHYNIVDTSSNFFIIRYQDFLQYLYCKEKWLYEIEIISKDSIQVNGKLYYRIHDD